MDEVIEQELAETIRSELDKYSPEVRNLIPPGKLESVTRQLYNQYWPSLEKKFKALGGTASSVFTEKLNTSIGVLSLSEKNSNLLMWSHYARSHKGFCIGFDAEAPFFHRKRSETDEFYHLRKVEYSEKRPTSRLSQLSGIELLFTKSLAWEYEQEWRMCAVLKDSEKTIEANPYAIHLFKFPITAVKEVILGACMENENKDKLLRVLNQKYSHAVVKQAKISSKEFKLEFVEF
ncbi:MAG: DUF2971 domain-containing protein [Oleiphilus sp.]|nr:MAG: DUF2971 domain-containing protein [Oleiphilus sp.]